MTCICHLKPKPPLPEWNGEHNDKLFTTQLAFHTIDFHTGSHLSCKPNFWQLPPGLGTLSPPTGWAALSHWLLSCCVWTGATASARRCFHRKAWWHWIWQWFPKGDTKGRGNTYWTFIKIKNCKGYYQQREKATQRMGENICKSRI